MSQQDRLGTGGRINRAIPLTFTFNGRTYQGFQGDTLASALLANGVHFVARSFKYHRPRGIMAAGVEEPNAVVQLESGPYSVPNARATEIELYQGLIATSVNAEPSLENDRYAISQMFSRFLPAGFYYKTFMWPRKMWPKYEEKIREAAGLGKAPDMRDADRYDKCYAHCDVLVVGGGPTGLAAAHAAAMAGASVILVDDQRELGGSLLSCRAEIDGKPALQWVEKTEAQLRKLPDVSILTRSTAFGYQDHNLVTVTQRLTDHLPISMRKGTRELLWKVRAKRVILATGAHERPIVFGNNDLPGVMLAGAVSTYIHRFGVLPGRDAVVFTNNDRAYQTALDLKACGAKVTVVDARAPGNGALPAMAKRQGVTVMHGAVITAASGKWRVSSIDVASYANGQVGGKQKTLPCDLVATSGGFSPVLHLFAQSGGKAQWNDDKACFVPGTTVQAEASVGAAAGEFALAHALQLAVDAGAEAAQAAGCTAAQRAVAPRVAETAEGALQPLWLIGSREAAARGPKQFVDFQNDVAVTDILLAAREGFESVEHVKRYTAMGFGTDQGKLGNINGMAILAQALGRSIPETGTTTFRPNYTPVSFGTFAGRELGNFLDPVRKTCIHEWHVEHGALFEDVGNWKRPWYFPKSGEDLHAAVKRECLAVRNGVGMLDASTLGKIDIQGPDAVKLLNWVYTNPWGKLDVGKCRYGLMLDENGMVFDDGVTVRLADQHFMMTTTTGGAARVLTWLERWLQTEWPDMKVRLASVTDHWATFAVVGPKSRKVVQKVCQDIDFGNEAFPFMSYRNGTVAGAKARVMRISFSGELAYEVNVPANAGRAVWEALMAAGAEFDITPYGTETMHVLRAEKGYIIVGQDTDGSITPYDLGMGGLVAKTKDCLGKRSLARSDTAKAGRKQFVGLLTDDAQCVLPEGAQIIDKDTQVRVTEPTPMIGHVTSSYYSPILQRSIALAVVKGGLGKMGESVVIPLANGRRVTAKIASPVFYDTEGVRQHVE
ncbi:sarcosine oxidase subunit alpha family protein [Ralstonia solanacearum]|uniref:Sarcosine oxidase subunit alpha n=1 Tax=Ralstonia solanacearum TaxID=305 RepID=A0A0S4UXH3_RALSL|nr:sarcosine oxidase subunit alpha family protein [Ralstonia pseudosolanacearum]APC68138.1 sarcosine oxidase subunit alpha family protein [Ralstonia solanacearum OE1-1]NKA08844.1 sarcosine oxidase subunit alpha family protein [Ralstonia solanacearum]API75211.1 sarcosine oxidase subunit alpha [Ralstonia pseudosolanacearum]ASL72353.1 sarcosine oxidase subunit alpha [Ralstonia pseudosolanacearum]MCK4118957.1 sarcosine oxidase subunit alpha family protein [Ralstonia pseudosolanacearum]